MDKHINFVCLFLLVSDAVAIIGDEEINVCDSGGVKCSASCKQIGVCLDDSSKDGYEWYPVRNCSENEYCSCVGPSCRCIGEVGSCVPNSRTITCLSAGLYPDPYDCNTFLWCDPHADNIVMTCQADHLYDACTGQCDITGTSCSIVPPICTAIGEVFQLENNNRIYFFCQDDGSGLLHPVMDRCSKGFFDPSLGKCVGEGEAGCIMGDTSSTVTPTSATNITSSPITPSTPSSTVTPTSATNITSSPITPSTPSSTVTPTSATNITSSPITPSTPITCNKIGSIPDPADCHSYYYCDSTLTPYHMKCSPGAVYDQQKGHCSPGSC
ncbi:uncharacterized protein [Anabrus simplex]|uniref:uncharacterized protein n=1 Tax=Anabrus simplex TaxID=316456 RepID=UPI0035A2D251